MGLITKPYTFTNGTNIDATEVNADFDTVYNAVNGGIDEDNFSGSIAIPNSALVDIDGTKVVDHADDLATYITATSPGDTGTPSLPGNLEAELERLRYRIQANAGFITQAEFMDNSAGAAASAGWIEPSVIGPCLLVNPGFEYDSSVTSGDPPRGWTEVGTLATSAITAAGTPAAGGHKRSFRFTTDASNEGISQQVQGLKASTKYLVGAAYLLNAGQLNITTSGAVSTADYEDLGISDTTTGSFRIQQGIIKTTTAAADVTVSLLGAASGADADIFFVWFRELGDNAGIGDLVSTPVKTATHNTEDTNLPATFTATTWNWEEIGELTLEQYVPGPGYRLVYEVTASMTTYYAGAINQDIREWGFRIQEDVNGGGDATVEGPYLIYEENANSNAQFADVMSFKFVRDNATAGSTYSYSFDIGVYNGGANHSKITLNPTLDGEQSVSRARLTLERM